MSNQTPLEDVEQITFVNWFERTYPNVLIFHIPNGGHRHKAVAQKMKQLGQKKGVPDLYIPEWNFWVEMKRVKGSATSKDQKEMIAYLNDIGHEAVICKGHEEAIKATQKKASAIAPALGIN